MLLWVVKDEKVPEDSLGEHYPWVLHTMHSYCYYRIILLNPKFAIKYVFMVISSSPYESGCPNDVKCALPAKRLDEEGAEGEVDNHADGGAHHRPGYEAATLL